MAELTIQISSQADALIAQLQKEIFNRRRKKVAPAGVVETLLESAAKSQSDKRFATSWKNLVADIDKAAQLVELHGSRPAAISEEEWALVLAHRSRRLAAAEAPAGVRSASPARPRRTRMAAPSKAAAESKPAAAKPTARKRAKPKATASSVAGRMAKAARRLPAQEPSVSAPGGNGVGPVSGNA
jgi:hypothetical protein